MKRVLLLFVLLGGCRPVAEAPRPTTWTPPFFTSAPSPAPLATWGPPLAAPAPLPIDAPPERRPSACNEQPPQAFLMRSTYMYKADATPEERARRKALHRAAVEYRTRRYGYVDSFGEPWWNRHAPKELTRGAKFMGVGVEMNARVLVALGCVEEDIRQTCGDTGYVPRVLDGLRLRNTFHDGEVSNHTYGIAVDIDPDKNSCCGCVKPLSDWPRCKQPVATPYERTAIPKCWIDTFERYGFYWLGHDELEDTMHFEFLGDPDKIRAATPQ